ncbi:MAG: glutathione peroxidase [Proteobacteria bacterium]|nr:glutathione peroxidase [Pseudomonadota bacterium]
MWRLGVAAALLGLLAQPALGGDDRSLLQFEAKRLAGPSESLSRYRGDVLLIVNTASRCGNTPQYEGLQSLYERYRERGFQVLGFPSNDFGRQEPGTDAEIGAFCRANYGVDFPMFSKVSVRGEAAHPVYQYLTSLPAPLGGPVEWNFQKYLVDREGRVVARFAPRTQPDAPELVGALERLLDASAGAGPSQPPAASGG